MRLRERLIQNLTFDFMLSGHDREALSTIDYFFDAFFDTKLTINKSKILEFESLLESNGSSEEALHKYLFDNPVLLDPLAIEIHSKHELGSEYITDFVIRKLNNEYVVVEIEKSTDKLFTNKGHIHSDMNEAISQVIDFQSWIHDNIAYARERLPGIRRPDGLLVIGRKKQLPPTFLRKLDEENYSRRGHLKIVTFDDLLDQAKAIYNNMLSRPLCFKGKKQI